ncbi:PLDc N-terminal domain-containing protein [Alishewanella sp. SMS8]
MVLPLIHVILSSRSHGGAKFGWSLAVVFFPILGYIIYLIVTQPAKKVLQS